MFKQLLQKNKREKETNTNPYSATIMVREKNNRRLHMIHSIKSEDPNKEEKSGPWTEVIGWYAGNEVLRFRQTPKC